MNVIRLGSVRRARSSSAALPTATRSRDSSSASASASVIRSPSSAFSRTRRRRRHAGTDARPATKRSSGTSVELADVAGQLEEREEPGALARAEAVAELLEVAREEAGRVAVALARLVREHARARRAPGAPRRRARPRARRSRRAAGRARPRRRRPSAARCARARAGRGRGAASDPRTRSQRRVADQQLRVGLLAERHVLRVRQQHLRQHDRGRALGRDRDGADPLERHRRDELDRVDRALGRDAEPRQEPQPVGVPRPLDRRDRRHVDLAGEQRPRELGRDAGDLLDLGVEPVEDRRHVHVRDAAEPHHRRISL